ncbi:MAG: hypothetical protein J4400_01835 [Candidatus Aenigmarchaeota archaeon]|nr:hypothetical protein [Candidatus Aenigmarchaeota archaeon]
MRHSKIAAVIGLAAALSASCAMRAYKNGQYELPSGKAKCDVQGNSVTCSYAVDGHWTNHQEKNGVWRRGWSPSLNLEYGVYGSKEYMDIESKCKAGQGSSCNDLHERYWTSREVLQTDMKNLKDRVIRPENRRK